jgi:pilus assembly protein CpaB
MRTKPIITTAFVGSIVVAAIAGAHMLSQKSVSGEPKAYILTTTVPLFQGTLLREQDVTWQGVTETKPGQFVRPSASQLEAKPELENQIRASVYGAVLRHELAAGAPIVKDAIVKPGERDFLQVVLTPGERAIAIPVATGGASTGLLSPGDRVDVILTQNFKNDPAQDMKNTPVTRRSVSETVVENLRVLAIDSPDTKPVGGGNVVNPATGNFGRTVTLEVTAEQAEQINVAAELGKLSLTLRSATDYASAAPIASPVTPIVRTVAHESLDGHVRPTWAGDVSPALSGAAQEKPVAVTPPTVTILRGFKPKDKEVAEPVTIKPES